MAVKTEALVVPQADVPLETTVLPDVATQPHSSVGSSPLPHSDDPKKRLQDVLPEISEVAQKVGGFKKLSEIADSLDRTGE